MLHSGNKRLQLSMEPAKKEKSFLSNYHKNVSPIPLAFYLRYWKHGAHELLLIKIICDFYCFNLFLSVLDE